MALEFSWNFARTVVEFLWNFAQELVEFVWNFAQVLVKFLWNFAQVLMEFIWNFAKAPVEFLLDFAQSTGGISLAFCPNTGGISLEFCLNTDGISLEFCQYTGWIPLKFCQGNAFPLLWDLLTCAPHGIQVIIPLDWRTRDWVHHPETKESGEQNTACTGATLYNGNQQFGVSACTVEPVTKDLPFERPARDLAVCKWG